MSSYKDLVVWQKAMSMVELVYEVTRGFPREESYGLTSQLRRAAVSVPSNIAEGQARQSNAEFKHFLSIARGSMAETETQLLIAHRLDYLNTEQLDESSWGLRLRLPLSFGTTELHGTINRMTAEKARDMATTGMMFREAVRPIW